MSQAAAPPKLHPAQVQPRRRRALLPDDIDKVGAAVLTLTKELWVLKDRQILLEEVLKRHNLDITEEINKLAPSGELEARLAAERQALVSKIMADLSGEYEPLA
jgi:predicted  nucleic acid-binding Zn-ribbon protein